MNEVTKYDAGEAIRRLSTVHKPPQNPDAVAEEWVKALRGASNEELESAVDAYLRDGGPYFPKPSQVRKLAMEGRKGTETKIPDTLFNRYLRWENDHGDEGCPVCGAKLKEITPESRGVPALEWDEKAQKLLEVESPLGGARAGVLHNPEKHQKARIPAIGYWTEPDVGPATRVGWNPDRPLTENLR